MLNVLFVLAGNSRTFIDCIDNIYINVISHLFKNISSVNIFIYFYLKLDDPGPKGQPSMNFQYPPNDYQVILDKINQMKMNYPFLNIDYKILHTDEISNKQLLAQVKNRKAYIGFYELDHKFVRGLHCHYNLEKCGTYILEKETSMQCTFDYIIYIRPDLFFTEKCLGIEEYNKDVITLGEGLNRDCNDHIAIIPRQYMNAFFFERMNLYRTNKHYLFTRAEDVYHYTIHYQVKYMGKYFINRGGSTSQ